MAAHAIPVIESAFGRLLVAPIRRALRPPRALLPAARAAVALSPEAAGADEERPPAPAAAKIQELGLVHPLA
jgi:hypothetical protein